MSYDFKELRKAMFGDTTLLTELTEKDVMDVKIQTKFEEKVQNNKYDYHSTAVANVYHTDIRCDEGNSIKYECLKKGQGTGRAKCKNCSKLEGM